jgi:predicted permease
MLQVLQSTIPVFLIILIGFILGKIKKGLNMDPVVHIIFYITSPALVFTSLTKSNVLLNDFLTIVLSLVLITFTMGFLVWLILKIKKSRKTGLYLPMTIGNNGYLGYPIALLVWGIDGLSRAVIYDVTGFILLLTVGIYILKKKDGLKEILKAAPIYAILAAIILKSINLKVPAIIMTPIEMVGAVTIPAALIVLGYRLTEIKVTDLKVSILASLFKIVIGLAIGLSIVTLFNIQGITRNIIILLSAMPSAVMTMIVTTKYKKNAALVASIVFISTLISILTIPLILNFLK